MANLKVIEWVNLVLLNSTGVITARLSCKYNESVALALKDLARIRNRQMGYSLVVPGVLGMQLTIANIIPLEYLLKI